MFGKKKKKRKMRIVVTGAEGVLLSCEPADFVPPEETLLALCLEYFNDANPCHIHRSAVCMRAVAELEQAVAVFCTCLKLAALEKLGV